MKQGFAYILASRRNGTLYVGVTNHLYRRTLEHRNGEGSIFTRKYRVHMLVWYEHHETVVAAIQRETSIKRWPRAWKLNLIEGFNPDWLDLFDTLDPHEW
jgi:putative endonuclease